MGAERDEYLDVLGRDALELGQKNRQDLGNRRRSRDVVNRDGDGAGGGASSRSGLESSGWRTAFANAGADNRRPSRIPFTWIAKRCGNDSSSVVSGSQHPQGTVTALPTRDSGAIVMSAASLSRYF